ncbi:anti-sigma factor [Amycolatopsis sp. H20-H5]|uniref:anti-sigma factor n=1 Tax=Amycolatopsis sp. H20-H5 TaxID=3046309 RepID=UPI002DBAE635|nr:anti-sigma factor [Amycolatopsis sp. H20-H5]MEC3979505.1 anti-sigma factor [Amycolatopsis sp. H20-H5]
MTTADVHALTGAYALNAVTDLERASFDRHLTECPACRQEVLEFRETTARLGAETGSELSESLRARVLAEIVVTRQLPPRVAGTGSRASRRWVKRAAIGVLSAAAAAALFVGGINLGRQGPAQEQTQAQGVPGAAVLAASDAVTVAARGTDGGDATAVVSRGQGQFVLNVRDLPALDSAHTYQAWLVGTHGPQSAGLLRPTGVLTGGLPLDTKVIAVTTEPAAGSPRPTTPGVVKVELA